ncbi:MAG: sulfite exporter TauE/SafE family protein [Chloroflexi bacterium]|nr:sulfite exporter TauE/SafE family protein [Chloroflexota bacterium]
MEGLASWDLGVPLDWRLVVALGAIFFASFAKGVAGLGVPIIATPILASLYDLRTAIVIVTLPMLLSDVPFVVRGLSLWRETIRLLPYALFGLVGIVVGARLLVTLSEAFLAAVLGSVVALFVVTSWFNALPLLSPRVARIVGPPLGLFAGVVQSSAGASGPLTTMYLLSLGIPRHIFLFAINATFQALDTTQFAALAQLGLYTPGLTNLAVLACLPMALGVFLGIKAYKHVDDALFRRVILAILALSAANLFARAAADLF